MPVVTTPRLARWTLTTAGAAALAIRVARSRSRRFLHPDGRSFAGRLITTGSGRPLGSPLLDRPGRHRVTVRISKGGGTPGARADIRGLAIRVHLTGRHLDLLLSTAGSGPITRHLPVPRRSFDTRYGTITPYRTASRLKVYLLATPDPDGRSLGRSLDEIAEGDRIVLAVRHDGTEHPFGRLELGHPLPPHEDAALAFDPVRDSLPELHPTGLVHGTRAFAYRLSQRWRGAEPAESNPEAVARTSAHR